MARRKFHRLRISDLTLGKNALQKTIAKTLDRTFDPRAIDHIDPNPDDAHPM
jgi:hypothetical protein